MKTFLGSICLVLAGLAARHALAEEAKKVSEPASATAEARGYQEKNAPTDLGIKLDGRLDDALWAKAQRFGPFYPSGGDKPVLVQTQALFAYDKAYLYVGFICDEPMIAKLKNAAEP